MNFIIFGAGYVGLSNALLLSQKYSVKLIDIDESKIAQLRERSSYINEGLIKKFLTKNNDLLTFDLELKRLNVSNDVVIIATPTNFDHKSKSFDTSSIKNVLSSLNKKGFSNLVIIRSTVPIGFTNSMQKKYPGMDIAFFPEFLREGHALEDNLYPSRIICGSKSRRSKMFLKKLQNLAIKKNTPTKITNPSDAEAIKLFSNSYLAMRIAFFNELDTFALQNDQCAEDIIEGVSMDTRIGNFYNNPSFGYGGYCLPKDTQQLNAHFNGIPQRIIQATIQSNKIRKKFIIQDILKKNINLIGIYGLSMKASSDNWRESAVIDIIKALKKNDRKIIIFEPMINEKKFLGCKIENNLNTFLNISQLIIANRLDKKIENYKSILYTRDLFREN